MRMLSILACGRRWAMVPARLGRFRSRLRLSLGSESSESTDNVANGPSGSRARHATIFCGFTASGAFGLDCVRLELRKGHR